MRGVLVLGTVLAGNLNLLHDYDFPLVLILRIMISLNSYAKLNIGLEILDEREDGFHDISTIMTKIDLSDQLYFE